MPFRRLFLALPLLFAQHAAAEGGDGTGRPPQYVVISFDGASFVSQWQRSRTLARQTGARFTYFLSCVYLLSPETRHLYQGPGYRAARSNVGFAETKEDVAARLGQVWAARQEGHEIASHGCGHFDGKDWSKADWEAEFAAFTRILRDAWTINGIDGEPEGWRDLAVNDIRGFRAPYLSTGETLYEALAETGLDYDASGVSRGPSGSPRKGGVRRFSLPMVPEGPAARPVIAMDYNLFARHTKAEETEDRKGRFEERAYRAFMAAFEEQHGGARIPLQIGYHFTLMNGGAYWRALERFAGEVCIKADVECVTYEALGRILDTAEARPGDG
jgi:peptidoglycan/xylan/chitin deacetylase (PgdA/CDA1 family)